MRIFIARFLTLAVALLAGFAYGGNLEKPEHKKQTQYEVVTLSSLGGAVSGGNSINNKSWVTGFSYLTGNQTQHATLWRDESLTDLGTLGGPGTNSSVAWPVKNNHGVIAGIAETDLIDPNHENWSCSFFFPSVTGHQCLGFVWKDGVMKPLPTLGGTHGFATGVNNRGQIVGWAENTVHDSTCNLPQVLQFRAVIYGPEYGQIQELPPFGSDTVGAATAINDKSQVVGISGICANAIGGFSAIHSVLWENGTVTDMGNIGGEAWNTPMAINKHGEVVGFANVAPGGGFNAHAFRWTKGSNMEDLGALPIPGHVISQALGINKRGQVVGISCKAGFADCRAFIWENGVMTDLNTLVESGNPGRLVFANDINDDGEITGGAFDSSTGESPAFLATPTGDED